MYSLISIKATLLFMQVKLNFDRASCSTTVWKHCSALVRLSEGYWLHQQCLNDSLSRRHTNTLKLSTLWHICHGSAPFDLLITINLFQKQVSALLCFKPTHPMAICSLTYPRSIWQSRAQMFTWGVSCSIGLNIMNTGPIYCTFKDYNMNNIT